MEIRAKWQGASRSNGAQLFPKGPPAYTLSLQPKQHLHLVAEEPSQASTSFKLVVLPWTPLP